MSRIVTTFGSLDRVPGIDECVSMGRRPYFPHIARRISAHFPALTAPSSGLARILCVDQSLGLDLPVAQQLFELAMVGDRLF
jgi:hypothetical protein